MFKADELFKQRFTNHVREMGRYLKYIFNGHLAVAMLFLISVLAFYYQQLLAKLPEDFPSTFMISLGFGLIITYSPIQTFLKEPDLVFLTPAEHQMDHYFRNSLIYSFILQLYQVLLVTAVLGPLYFHTYDDRSGRIYLLTILLLVVFKGWNLIIHWWAIYGQDPRYERFLLFIRMILNIFIFYFVLTLEIGYALFGTLLFFLLCILAYKNAKKEEKLPWVTLVEQDLKSRRHFYQIANMFTDVPHIKNAVRRRSWLVRFLTRRIPMKKRATYAFLYRLSFARSDDYFRMYLRLLVLGGLAVYFIPNLWLKLGMMLLFLYLSSFQLVTLHDHYRTNIWVDLYPVPEKLRRDSLIKLLVQLSVGKTIIFSLIFITADYVLSIFLALGAGLSFTFLFVRGYLHRKIEAK